MAGGVGRYVVEAKDTRLGLRAALGEAAARGPTGTPTPASSSLPEKPRTPAACHCRPTTRRSSSRSTKTTPTRWSYGWPAPGLASWRAALPARAGEGPSLERMRELVGEAQRCLGQASGIRRCHSTASRAVSEAADKLNDMLAAIASTMNKLEVEVDRS